MSDTMTINGRAYRCTTPRFSIKAAMMTAITSFMVGGLISMILLFVFFPLGLLSALLTLALPFVMGSIIRTARSTGGVVYHVIRGAGVLAQTEFENRDLSRAVWQARTALVPSPVQYAMRPTTSRRWRRRNASAASPSGASALEANSVFRSPSKWRSSSIGIASSASL